MVTGGMGEYDDHVSWIVRAYWKEDQARDAVDGLNEKAQEVDSFRKQRLPSRSKEHNDAVEELKDMDGSEELYSIHGTVAYVVEEVELADLPEGPVVPTVAKRNIRI